MRSWKPDVLVSLGQDPPQYKHPMKSGDNLRQTFLPPSIMCVKIMRENLRSVGLPTLPLIAYLSFQLTTENPEFNKLWFYIYGLCMYLSCTGNFHHKIEHLLHSTKGKKWKLEDLKGFYETCFSVCYSLGCNRVNFVTFHPDVLTLNLGHCTCLASTLSLSYKPG